MARFIYSASFDAVAVTTAIDLFHFTVATDNPIYLYGLTLGQSTDLGDANEEVLRIGLYRGVTGGTGSAGTSTEVAYLNTGSPVADAAVLGVTTAASTAGTLLEVITWNIRVPLMWFPIPELRPRIDAAEDPVAFRLIAAPTDSITMSGTVFWAEG